MLNAILSFMSPVGLRPSSVGINSSVLIGVSFIYPDDRSNADAL